MRGEEDMVAAGTWPFHIHSPLLDYFRSTHVDNYALNLVPSAPLLEEQSMVPHVFYFIYRFLRLRFNIVHRLAQTCQESLLLTLYLACRLCNYFIPFIVVHLSLIDSGLGGPKPLHISEM